MNSATPLPRRKPIRRQSTLDQDFAMDTQPGPQPGEPVYVVFVGAGGINFGSITEGPWNHSFRLEHKLGPRMNVVALIDPNVETRKTVLARKRNSFVVEAYRHTKEFNTLRDYIQSKPNPVPHVFIVGIPPAFHGGVRAGADAEIVISNSFPKAAMFLEKPLSSSCVADVMACNEILKTRNHIISVGYMFRYLKCVQMAKELLIANNLIVSGIVARYACCYPSIEKTFWWNKLFSCGPVIEQGTHFVDLCRFFGGEVIPSTVQASSLEHDEPAGKLSALGIDEDAIEPDNRIPRMTTASWKFENGAVCAFTHSLLLHGTKFDNEFVIYCDGWQLRLVDVYNSSNLYVRSPLSADHEECYRFADDDPYFGEFSVFIDAIENRDSTLIASSFEDAAKTYELTWLIREASERSSRLAKDAALATSRGKP